MGRYGDAIENIHLAISLSPKESVEAVQVQHMFLMHSYLTYIYCLSQELDRVEGLLRGENFEGQEDEEENEEEDDDQNDKIEQ
jgi:hypothetical protein